MARAANVRQPVGADEHTQSHRHLLWHLRASSGRDMVRQDKIRMSAHLGLPDPKLAAVPGVENPEARAKVMDADMEPEVQTPGPHSWTDAMLERAVRRPVRHTFQ